MYPYYPYPSNPETEAFYSHTGIADDDTISSKSKGPEIIPRRCQCGPGNPGTDSAGQFDHADDHDHEHHSSEHGLKVGEAHPGPYTTVVKGPNQIGEDKKPNQIGE